MATLFSVLHVVTAVFLVGPMAVLPMTALRALRAGNGPMVSLLGRSTFVFSIASLLVVVFGFGILGIVGEDRGISVSTGWILWSIVLYLVGLALNLAVVVPALRKAAAGLSGASGAAGRPAQYGAIAAGSGLVSLLLIAVTVLMVWKP